MGSSANEDFELELVDDLSAASVGGDHERTRGPGPTGAASVAPLGQPTGAPVSTDTTVINGPFAETAAVVSTGGDDSASDATEEEAEEVAVAAAMAGLGDDSDATEEEHEAEAVIAAGAEIAADADTTTTDAHRPSDPDPVSPLIEPAEEKRVRVR